MESRELWRRMVGHPMSGWRVAEDVALPVSLAPGRLLWCGIGGSLLPADALIHALAGASLRHRWQPLASPECNGLRLEPEDQLVFASKSGRTLELWTWIGRLRAQTGWGRWRQAPIAITQDDENPLAQLARAEGWTLLPIPEQVGGRYSAFTAIGALPLRWAGLDPGRFLAGARDVVAQTQEERGIWGERVWEMARAFSNGFLRGTEIEFGKYIKSHTFVSAKLRPDPEALKRPGLYLQHRFGGLRGYSLETSFEPRFLLREPSLALQTPSTTTVFGLFLIREWRF